MIQELKGLVKESTDRDDREHAFRLYLMEKNYINSITDNYKWGELGISGRLTKSGDCRAYFETGEMSYNDFINLFETAKSVKKRKGRTGIDLIFGNETDEETSLPPSEPKVLRIRNSQQGASDSDLLVFPVEFFNVEGKAQFM